jgi:hypothetical protein
MIHDLIEDNDGVGQQRAAEEHQRNRQRENAERRDVRCVMRDPLERPRPLRTIRRTHNGTRHYTMSFGEKPLYFAQVRPSDRIFPEVGGPIDCGPCRILKIALLL